MRCDRGKKWQGETPTPIIVPFPLQSTPYRGPITTLFCWSLVAAALFIHPLIVKICFNVTKSILKYIKTNCANFALKQCNKMRLYVATWTTKYYYFYTWMQRIIREMKTSIARFPSKTASTEHSIGCKQQPIGCSVEAVATMIGCLPTQALAFSPVSIQTQHTQRMQRKRLRLDGNRA